MPRQTFFENTVVERDLGNDLLQLAVLGPEILDFIARRFTNRVACQLLLAGFEEVLAPAVIQVRHDPALVHDSGYGSSSAGSMILSGSDREGFWPPENHHPVQNTASDDRLRFL